MDNMTIQASLHFPTALVRDARPDIPRPYILWFSKIRKDNFTAEIKLEGSDNIKEVEKKTRRIIKKAYLRVWILNRLKALGASKQHLIKVLQNQVPSFFLLTGRPCLGLYADSGGEN